MRKLFIVTTIAAAFSPITLQAETCDVGKVSERVAQKYELPELPSALEDCGIGGFLSFDFGFDISDINLGDLFCGFAQDLIGDFSKSLTADFSLGQNGLSINSPVYSVNTASVDTLLTDAIYRQTGRPDGAILDNFEGAYNSALRDTQIRNGQSGSTPRTFNSRSGGNFAAAVRGGSNINPDDVTSAAANIRDINIDVGAQQYSEEPINTPLSNQQLQLLNNLSADDMDTMSDADLAGYLDITVTQLNQLTSADPVTPPPVVIPRVIPNSDNPNVSTRDLTSDVNNALLESLFGEKSEKDDDKK